MRGRPLPQTPAQMHAEAVSLLNEAQEYPVNSAAFLAINTRAAAFASLSLYRPVPRAKTTTTKEPTS